jgi:hypothetical protein
VFHILSTLRANVLDAFYRAGVEIMILGAGTGSGARTINGRLKSSMSQGGLIQKVPGNTRRRWKCGACWFAGGKDQPRSRDRLRAAMC